MNVDILGTSDCEEEYKNIMSYYGYESFINTVTRPASKTCLDHFFMKETGVRGDHHAFAVHSGMTDHFPVLICPDIQTVQRKNPINCKSFVDYKNLKNDLSEINWDEIAKNTNVDEFAGSLNEIITKLLDHHTNRVSFSSRKFAKKDWVTPSLLKAINKKNKMYKDMLKEPNNTLLKQSYIQFRNSVNSLISRAKKDHSRNFIEKNKSQSRNLWKHVTNICSQQKMEMGIEGIKGRNGELITDKEEIADAFNEYFSGVGREYAERIEENEQFKDNDK